MTEEEIILAAFRLCKEIETMGFHTVSSRSGTFPRLDINVYALDVDKTLKDKVFSVYCYLDGYLEDIEEKKPIEQLTKFINHQKQQVA